MNVSIFIGFIVALLISLHYIGVDASSNDRRASGSNTRPTDKSFISQFQNSVKDRGALLDNTDRYNRNPSPTKARKPRAA
ncbi:hypothetical protein HCN44_000476 [Aphidius gifuensis]|nr:hypothetical protein HCN44_000476 [Aphidius gifuensis]